MKTLGLVIVFALFAGCAGVKTKKCDYVASLKDVKDSINKDLAEQKFSNAKHISVAKEYRRAFYRLVSVVKDMQKDYERLHVKYLLSELNQAQLEKYINDLRKAIRIGKRR